MDRNDQQAIERLFRKLEDVEHQATPRDAEADAFIRRQIAAQPGAPYYMAQTIVVQEQALERAQARIEELEAAEAPQSSRGGGLLDSVFGGGRSDSRSGSRSRGSVPRVGRGGAAAPVDPYAQGGAGYAQRGGGFLAGAAQTAMGVAGGVLLGSAIGGMFGGNEATAAEAQPAADDPQLDDAGDEGGDFGGGDFGGGDFGGEF